MKQLKIDRNSMNNIKIFLPSNLNMEIDFFKTYLFKDVPDFVKYDIWWNIKDSSLIALLKKENHHADIKAKYGSPEIIKDVTFYDEFCNNLWCTLSYNDYIKIWLYYNHKDLWNELLKEFKTEKRIFNLHLEFNHSSL